MNAQQIAAYEQLVAKVPDARCTTCHPTGSAVSPAHALAILTDHLERMLPPGATLLFPDKVSQRSQFNYYDSGYDSADPDRFIAVCKAVEASR